VTGSSAEFYFQMAMQVNGIQPGKDVILKNMPPGEQMALPKGIDGVVSWDPTPTMMVEERKNGRIIDSIFPYNMYEGSSTFAARSSRTRPTWPGVLRRVRRGDAVDPPYPDKAADLMAEDPTLKNFSKAILLQQIHAYNNLYKPTNIYPHAQFWGAVNETIFNWLYEQKRITQPLKAKDFVAAVDERFMKKTFEKLGWTVPKQPPFIPAAGRAIPPSRHSPTTCTRSTPRTRRRFRRRATWRRTWSFGGQPITRSEIPATRPAGLRGARLVGGEHLPARQDHARAAAAAAGRGEGRLGARAFGRACGSTCATASSARR
jgi:sulfonate transport system substrate-binding protein